MKAFLVISNIKLGYKIHQVVMENMLSSLLYYLAAA